MNKYRSYHQSPNGPDRVIPSIVTISKRLAQCLDSTLPAGVHLKALETYQTILSLIGSENLIVDLSLYSVGLFPLLSYGSTIVLPKLLYIYETYFLPLGHRLDPALNGFILALLLGLEDSHSELYPRIMMIMNVLKNKSDLEHFVVSIWKAMLHCPQTRLAVMNYTSETFKNANNDIAAEFIPRNPSLCVEALLSGLRDENPLVQRGMFDLVIKFYPMDKSRFGFEDDLKLIDGILPALIKRDSSVNRRIYI